MKHRTDISNRNRHLEARERILRDHERGKLPLHEARRQLDALDYMRHGHVKEPARAPTLRSS